MTAALTVFSLLSDMVVQNIFDTEHTDELLGFGTACTNLRQCFNNCWLHLQSKNVSYIKIKTDDLESWGSYSSPKNFPRLTMSGNIAALLPGSVLAPAIWQATLCRPARAGNASSHPSPGRGERKARQTEVEHRAASEAAEQLLVPLTTPKEATTENAECN